MSVASGYPIVIIAFDRSDYLRLTLESLLAQVGADVTHRPIYLFQDGAINDFSGRQHCDPAVVAANVAIFQSLIPHGTAMPASANLGVARNFHRAECFVFQDLQAEAAIFLEDDLVLGPYYLKTLEKLIGLALGDERIGYVAAYGNHRASAEEQRRRRTELMLLGHNWAFALTRRQWLRQKPYVDQYMDIVGTSDYRGRDHARIVQLFHSWGLGAPGTSQDIAKTHAAVLTQTAKINTFACFGHYIGKQGLHFDPEQFKKMGFGDTAVMNEDVFELVPPSDDRLKQILDLSRASAMHENKAIPGFDSPTDLDRSAAARALLAEMLALRERGHLSEAEAQCRVGMSKYPEYRDQYGHPAFLKEALRLTLTLRLRDRAIRLGEELQRRVKPTDPCVPLLFGRHARQIGDLVGARRSAEEVLRLDPRNPEAVKWLELAV